MFDFELRVLKDKILYKTGRVLGKILSPNQITVVAFIFGLISSFFIFDGNYVFALLFWILNRIFDGLDGTVARVYNKSSDLGGYIDIVTDFVIYATVPITFVIHRGLIIKELLILAIMLASFYINAASWMYLSSILEKRKHYDNSITSVNMPRGLIEGFESIVFYTLFYIIPDYIIFIYSILAFLTIISTIQRVVWSIKVLN